MTTSRGAKTSPARAKASGTEPQTSLREKIADGGFTPSIRAIDELLLLFADEDEDVAKSAERAVLRIEVQYAARVAKHVVDHATKGTRPARGRLTHLAGRLAATADHDPESVARTWVILALTDEDPKTRRASARALGKMERSPDVEAALADAFDRATSEDDKKIIALSLGKVGGDAARARLNDGAHARASLLLEREAARATHHGGIDASRASDRPLRVWFHTRSGLEDVVKEELVSRSFTTASTPPPRFVAPGIIEGVIASGVPLSHATQIRTATHIGFPLTPLNAKSDNGDVIAEVIVRAIASKEALGIFRAFARRDEGSEADAPIRFRIAFVKGGHRRAVVWRCAELMREKERSLVNDPKDSTWEALVDEVPVPGDDGHVQLKIELLPRGLEDDRFGYREELVAASSHPTIAAALIRVAPRHDDDVVWDPFVGAAAELVERAMIGPYARLIGTDVDTKAVKAAHHNIARAGLDEPRITVEEGDACTYAPSHKVTLIVTNPPMGRRVERGTHRDLLVRFVTHAADVLAPGGALVWMVPEPQAPIRERAASVGLDLVRSFSVDMGGFSAELSIFIKRPKTRPETRQETRQETRPETRGPTRKIVRTVPDPRKAGRGRK